MLALGVGNAWGAEVTFDATSDKGSTSTGAVSFEKDGITLSAENGALGNGTDYRIYKNTKLTISSSVGSITNIAFTFKSASYDGGGWSASYQPNAAEWTSPVANGEQARITKIVVTYTPSTGGGETPGEGGGEEPTPDPEDPTPGTGGTVTYTVSSVTAVTTTGNVPQGSSASLSGTGSLNSGFIQCTNGKNHTLTLTGYEGYKITGVTIHVKSNSSKGTGSFSVVAGSTTIASIAESAFSSTNWNGSWNTTGVDKTLTMTNDSYEIQSGENVTLTINCKSGSSNYNSLYVKSYTITYMPVTSSGGGSGETVPSLTQEQFSWSTDKDEVTMGDATHVYPTLVNTIPVPVEYTSNPTTVATIDKNTGIITLVAPGTTTISAIFEGGEVGGTKYAAKTVDYTLTVKPAPLEPIAGGVIDILDNVWSGLTTSDYATVAAKTAANTGHSNAQYTAQCAGSNSSIQLRSTNSNSGIVSTVSGGLVKRVEIEWNDATSTGRTLNIYGSNTPYTNPTDLYDTNKDGDKLGTIVKGTSTYLEISKDYRYIGIRSASGAMYLAKVTITWLPINSKVSIDDAIQHGSVSVTGATDLNAVAAGTLLTLDNTPATGYKLTAYDVYKTDDATTKVTVTDGKFIMPEFDVTISATFEAAKTLTGLDITTPATQTTFWQGEAFNHEGLKVTAHFDGADDEDVTSKLTVTGSTATSGTQTVTVSFKEGEVTKTATYQITVKAIPNTKETAYTVAEAYDIIDKLTTAEGVFISGIISQVDSYNGTYKSITYWISADGTTTKQLQVYSGKGLESADFSGKTDLSVGDQVIVCGNLKKYDGTYEFDKNNYLVVHTKTTKADPELSYATTEYNVNLGDAFTAPTLNNPNGLTVSYSSSNTDVATVAADGAVTIKAAGTVTITASFAGNDTYVSGSASYTINITDPNVSEVTFVAGTDKSDTKSISKNGITVEFADGSFSRDDNYRCYAGQSMTISYNDGTITKIVIECTANNDAEYGPGQFATETATYLYSGKVGTWTGEAKSVTFASTKQVRMTKITVYYKQDKRANSELAWSEESVNLTVGDDFTAPTFNNPNNLAPISFISDNTALATVNNVGVISLKAGAVGTATITAKYAGNETYKDAEVSCTITVNPKTEEVVIVAQREGKWYALKAATGSSTNSLAALEVEYINGVLYNVNEADKASITWKRTVVGNLETFQYGDKYLKGSSSTNLFMEEGAEGKYQWDKNAHTMLIGSTTRTFLYQGTYFKNYAISNAGKTVDGNTYSALPIVTAAKFENATIEKRDSLDIGNFGTICYKNKITNYEGVTFYAVAGREGRKVIFDEVTELEAGMPYLFRAEAAELKIAFGNETASDPGYYKSLQGTFTQIDPAEENILTGNYVMYNNMIKKCGKNCGLKANRAYFIGSDLEILGAPASQAPGRKRVSMDVLGENEATSVDNITENGVIAPAMQGTYDVLGRQLSEPTVTGFYIVNGKKVLVVK